jgi:Rhodanese-related sulfurtransferase
MTITRIIKLGTALAGLAVSLILSASDTKKRIIDLQTKREEEKAAWQNRQTDQFLSGLNAFRETPGALLLDVREEEDYHAGHIPGSTFVSLQAIPTPVLQTVSDKGTPLFVYCYRGNRSRYVVSILKEAGYTNVTNIGGIEFYHGDLEKS